MLDGEESDVGIDVHQTHAGNFVRLAARFHPRHLGTTRPVVYDGIEIRSGG